jgi:MurNAc alpha-1-phosphate uridylyltransferase
MKAMIFSAGLGTRFKPWTDKHPKALAVINGKSLLQRNIEYLQQFGITEIVVNVHHFAHQIVEAVTVNKGWGSNVKFSDEMDQVLETGGGLKKAAYLLEGPEPFVAINVDILTDMALDRMIEYHKQYSPIATIAVSDRKTSRYFLFDESMNLSGWRNIDTGQQRISKKRSHYSQKAFSGIHIIEPRIFSLIPRLEKISTVDIYLELAKTELIKGYEHTGSKFVDVGRQESVAVAEAMFE